MRQHKIYLTCNSQQNSGWYFRKIAFDISVFLNQCTRSTAPTQRSRVCNFFGIHSRWKRASCQQENMFNLAFSPFQGDRWLVSMSRICPPVYHKKLASIRNNFVKRQIWLTVAIHSRLDNTNVLMYINRNILLLDIANELLNYYIQNSTEETYFHKKVIICMLKSQINKI